MCSSPVWFWRKSITLFSNAAGNKSLFKQIYSAVWENWLIKAQSSMFFFPFVKFNFFFTNIRWAPIYNWWLRWSPTVKRSQRWALPHNMLATCKKRATQKSEYTHYTESITARSMWVVLYAHTWSCISTTWGLLPYANKRRATIGCAWGGWGGCVCACVH